MAIVSMNGVTVETKLENESFSSVTGFSFHTLSSSGSRKTIEIDINQGY